METLIAGDILESNMGEVVTDSVTYRVCISFSAYLICGKVEDVVLQSGCRMWCTQSTATDTTAVASSAPETAVRNSSDLAGEKIYCMRRGDCR